MFKNVFGTGQVTMTTANTTARQQALVTGYINAADTDWYETSVVNAVGYVDGNAGGAQRDDGLVLAAARVAARTLVTVSPGLEDRLHVASR